MNTHLIAIVGGSGSGKSWLAQTLAEQFGEEIVRAMKAGGITCVEYKGRAEDAVGKVLQLQQKEAVQ